MRAKKRRSSRGQTTRNFAVEASFGRLSLPSKSGFFDLSNSLYFLAGGEEPNTKVCHLHTQTLREVLDVNTPASLALQLMDNAVEKRTAA